MGFAVAEATGRDVCYLDIRRYPCTHPKVALQLYDGRRIPYADDSFESSMAIFMLHHTEDAEVTLCELTRVTRRTLVVFEDVLPSHNMLLIQIFKDILNNYFFEGPALQHKTELEWEELFTRLDLTMRKKIHFGKRTWINSEHVGWQLDLPGHAAIY
ncbi:MAG: methyltransferase domain-containing protein [Sedimentisphaerales bacterium]|nr:methyltransferase domain-containing protein [Sedimentisphaerales bacterium]